MPALKYWDGAAWQLLGAGGGGTVFEQPNDPGAQPSGTIWIDTDDVPLTYQSKDVYMRLVRTANSGNLPTNAWYVVPWQVAELDTDGMWAAASPGLMTVKTAGKYVLTAGVAVTPGDQVNNRHIAFRKNGTTFTRRVRYEMPALTNPPEMNISQTLNLNVNDTIEVMLWPGNATTAQVYFESNWAPSFEAVRVDTGGVYADRWHTIGDPGEPAFQNSWTNYGAPFGPVRFTKLSSGLVVVDGLANPGTITNGTLVFTLPPGYRPTPQSGQSDRVLIFGGAQQLAPTNESFRLSASGALTWTGSTTAQNYVSFNAITFYANA